MLSERSLVVVDICDKACGLPLENVQEIVPIASLYRPPTIPSLLDGFLNLRGTAVPVIRLGRVFRLEERPLDLYTPLVILRGGGYLIALLVDSVSCIFSVSGDALLPVQKEHCFNDCTEAEAVVEGRVIHVLSLERLLIEKQRQFLEEFQEIEQQRLNDLEERRA
jgi:purine-binding chemotaxis protein CheW